MKRFGVLALLVAGLGVSAQAGSSAPAIAQISKQFDDHPLIMIGELHRYEQLHAFMREMIGDPGFICRADDIVVEFGNSRLQALADRYMSGGKVTGIELQSLWRETAVPLTWNSPVYRQFYQAVREINQKRLCPHPIRIVLGDPPLDWSKIKTAKDYEQWTDRDGSFASVVEREVLSRHHRAFLLAGVAHAVKCGGSELEHADSGLIRKRDPGQRWPAMVDVVEGVLYLGGEPTHLYPSPAIYLDPVYQRELRRRAAIIKESSGQDFLPVIDGLVKEAGEAQKARQP